MKTFKKILSLVLIAGLVISGSAQAMWRPSQATRFSQIRIQNKFQLPSLPAHRIDKNVINRYNDLCDKWNWRNRSYEENRKSVRNANIMTTFGLSCWPALAANIVPHDQFILPCFLMGGLYGAVTATSLPWINNKIKKDGKTLQKIESQLADIVKDQKRELALRDDIQ